MVMNIMSFVPVDCSSAGDSQLTAEVMNNNQPVLYEIEPDESPGHHKITFTPTALGEVILNVFYGGYRIPGRQAINDEWVFSSMRSSSDNL